MRYKNGLNKVTAAGGVLVGVFLMLGAYGHFSAVLPSLATAASETGGLSLLLPGIVLAAAGVLSASLCKQLWDGKQWAFNAAAAINAVALGYLLYLLWRGVPDHPVALFTGIVACNLALLVAVRAGLVWPAEPSESASGEP